MAEVESGYVLASVERVLQHLGGDAQRLNTEEVLKVVRSVSVAIERECGRRFRSRAYTHDGTTLPRMDSWGGTKLWLPNAPVTAVSSLKLYPGGTALTEWDGTSGDYVVVADEGLVELLGLEFWRQRRVVEITYTAGFLDSPTAAQELAGWGWAQGAGDVELACVLASCWIIRGKDRAKEGVASRSFEGVTTAYLTDAALALPDVKDLLSRYRWERPVASC